MTDILVNGIRLHYEVHGEGTPLVLAHGFGATVDMWSGQIEAFSQKYRLVVYDSRGHGRTEAPRDWTSYNLDDYVEDQRQLMDHLGIDTAHVGGLSMGGMIALQFGLTYPERVRALLLCDTSASNLDLQGRRTDAQDGGIGAAVQRVILRQVVPLGFAFARYLPLERLAQLRDAPVGVKSYVRNLRVHTALGLRGGWHAIMTRQDVEDRLDEIRVPTLIVVGDRDRLLAPSRLMQQRIRGSRFVLIKGSPHGTADWRPEAFNEAVLGFLEDVEAGRPVEGETAL
jgi:pimeloyl-ACP methyl ester carboxylesterase